MYHTLGIVFVLLCVQGQTTTGPSGGTPCMTVPQALMTDALNLMADESRKGSSEPCVANGTGPGIFTPPGVSRAYQAVATAMYNAWTRFDTIAAPTVQYAGWSRTIGASSNEMTQAFVMAVYAVEAYLLPEGVVRAGLADKYHETYGVEVSFEVSITQNPQLYHAQQGANALIEQLRRDGFNQEGCYRDTSNYFPVNDVMYLDNSTVIRSYRPRHPFHWTPLAKTGFLRPQRFAVPHAMFARTFAIAPLSLVPPLPNMTTFHSEMRDVARLQGSLNETQLVISEYWADGPGTVMPPGHWLQIAMMVLQRQCSAEPGNDVRMLFTVANALHDSCIACWATKRVYDSVRPQSYIPTTFANETFENVYRGPYCPRASATGEQWMAYQVSGGLVFPGRDIFNGRPDVYLVPVMPVDVDRERNGCTQLPTFVTPAFSEFVSGHSTFSAAAATALELMTGSAFVLGGPFYVDIPAGSSRIQPQCFQNNTNLLGRPCAFSACSSDASHDSANSFLPAGNMTLGPYFTYNDMAVEAGLSRRYGGIHVNSSDVLGREMGRRVGEIVVDRARQLFGGNPGSPGSVFVQFGNMFAGSSFHAVGAIDTIGINS